MSNNAPELGRITLTLTTRTIKALRLLALLKDETQNEVAEALLIAGGLYNAVDNQWREQKPVEATGTISAPKAAPEPSSTPQLHPALPSSTPKPPAAAATPSTTPQPARPITPQVVPAPKADSNPPRTPGVDW